MIGFFGTVVEKAISAGSAIKGVFSSGGGAITAPAGGVALAPLADARALGGTVTYGKPYPVGERGPRLFVPGMSGRIHARLLVRFEVGTTCATGKD